MMSPPSPLRPALLRVLAPLAAALCLIGPVHAASPARKAMVIAQEASIELAGHRYLKAAELMDQAFALDPDPIWRANAGYARMMAGQLDHAIVDLSAALGDKRLVAVAREQATTRLGLAKSAKDARSEADAARARGDFKAAAEVSDKAWQSVEIGPFMLDAATLWEMAGDLDTAEARLREANTRPDLSPEERSTLSESLIRVADAKRAANVREPGDGDTSTPRAFTEPASPVLGWTLVGAGAGAVALGVVSFIVSGSEKRAAEAITDPNREGEFDDLDENAETWWNVGLVSTSIGLAAAVTGIILVVTHDRGAPQTRGSVDVGGAMLPGGGMFTTTLRF